MDKMWTAVRPNRGVNKNHAWLQTRTAALNLRRLLNLGLIRTEGTWVVTC